MSDDQHYELWFSHSDNSLQLHPVENSSAASLLNSDSILVDRYAADDWESAEKRKESLPASTRELLPLLVQLGSYQKGRDWLRFELPSIGFTLSTCAEFKDQIKAGGCIGVVVAPTRHELRGLYNLAGLAAMMDSMLESSREWTRFRSTAGQVLASSVLFGADCHCHSKASLFTQFGQNISCCRIKVMRIGLIPESPLIGD